MKKYIKTLFLASISALTFVSCDTDAEFDIPEIKQLFLFEGFEDHANGSGSIEIPIALTGWANYNLTNNRYWNCKLFSNNKYAEFSSFYSVAPATDVAWLVTPEKELGTTKTTVLSFDTKVRFYNASNLTVYVSENYDGTQAGISTATWTQLNPTLPTSAAQNDLTINSGKVDLSAYKGKKVRIGFKYVGSKAANTTTTFQLDNIKLFENE